MLARVWLWVACVVTVVLVAAGCADVNPTAAGELVVEPIQVESVDVRVIETVPPRAVAHVRGVLGDGCSELHSLRQERSGTTVTVTISRQRPRDAVCIQIAKMYDEDVTLDGEYPPGRYVVRVNDVATPFTTR